MFISPPVLCCRSHADPPPIDLASVTPTPTLLHLQNDLMQRELDHMSELAARQEQQLK